MSWATSAVQSSSPIRSDHVGQAVAVLALQLRLGMPSDGTASTHSTQRRAYDALARGFGPGVNGPLVIVADLSRPSDRKIVATAIQADLATVSGVVHATPATLNPSCDLAMYTAIPATGPSYAATETLVRTLRGDAAGWQRTTGTQSLRIGSSPREQLEANVVGTCVWRPGRSGLPWCRLLLRSGRPSRGS